MRPYIKGKDAACVVILMENCISYPEPVMLSDKEIAFNVVDIPLRTLALLKKSTDSTRLLGSRKKLAQVLNVPGIRYLIAIWNLTCAVLFHPKSGEVLDLQC